MNLTKMESASTPLELFKHTYVDLYDGTLRWKSDDVVASYWSDKHQVHLITWPRVHPDEKIEGTQKYWRYLAKNVVWCQANEMERIPTGYTVKHYVGSSVHPQNLKLSKTQEA